VLLVELMKPILQPPDLLISPLGVCSAALAMPFVILQPVDLFPDGLTLLL
jgi:hypothetical protein